MKLQILITPRAALLDPQGKTIETSLKNIGFSGFNNIKVGKVINYELDEKNIDKAMEISTEAAEKLLANPVMEDYKITVIEK